MKIARLQEESVELGIAMYRESSVCVGSGFIFRNIAHCQQRVADSDTIRCIEEEREALLVFKQGLAVDESGRLSSWGGENDKRNCCEWRGLYCSQTGHVEGLDLSDYNNFGESPIPEFIGSLSKLSYLSLSYAQFAGPIPHQLGNLSSLQFLDLSGNDNLFSVGNLDWLSHLSSLRYLNLSVIDLSKSNGWFQVVKKLPFLTDLKLNGCNLPPISPSSPSDDVNSTTFLASLDLSHNNIGSAIYSWLFNISSNLVDLVLDSNHLQGLLPDAFGHMISLSRFSLKSNDLEGVIPKSLGSMSSLLTLDLSSNKFIGSVPEFTRFSPLKDLRLGENHLNGTITKSIGHMSELERLDLHGNSLQGVIYEDFFLNLTKLKDLDLSHNSLALEFSNDWVPPFHLSSALLASCKMGPHFPKWLRTQEFIAVLDISNAEISDTIPDWFWDIYRNFVHFNISHNQIKGNLPDFSSFTRFSFAGVDFSSNHLEGPLLSLPSCISYIDLSGNKFSGPISFICSVCVPGVSHLDLSSF
ncbi:receptor-like protein EIX2 [Pistacia vera]|uniref:receptor-like protein EIX2 n=1 Tax=Pistacia vera TaxID=55513 RepID=UPI0012631F53|nr:receptor-like protein EIX2 [Pistacia vera]